MKSRYPATIEESDRANIDLVPLDTMNATSGESGAEGGLIPRIL